MQIKRSLKKKSFKASFKSIRAGHHIRGCYHPISFFLSLSDGCTTHARFHKAEAGLF